MADCSHNTDLKHEFIQTTPISYNSLGDMILLSEWISGKKLEHRHYKWLLSNKNAQKFKEVFNSVEISNYKNYLNIIKECDSEYYNKGQPRIWIIGKTLNVKIMNETHKTVITKGTKPKYVMTNPEKLISVIKTDPKYANFSTYLEEVMSKPNNNDKWIQSMRNNLKIVNGTVRDLIDTSKINNDISDDMIICKFIENNQTSDIINWSQFCALICILSNIVSLDI